MNPRQRLETEIEQAKRETARATALFVERTQECREATRRLREARTRLEHLLTQATALDAQPGVR